MGSGVGAYYDRLGRWNRVARLIGHDGGSGALTVHRALADPHAGGRPTFTRLHDVLLEHLPPLKAPRVLDAGCGLGGTMLALAAALGARCVGVTLSESQARRANDAAARAGLADQVHAVVQSFDAPPRGPFDLVVAIESLAHSQEPRTSVSMLAAVLAPGGVFAIVDDMPEPAAIGTPDLETFMAGWQCPVLTSEAGYREALAACGLEVRAAIDLTSSVRPRSRAAIGALMAANRLAHAVATAPARQVLDAHRGGLALERLTRAGLVRYRLVVAQKPELQVS
jgi:SAM-dependent methyltransferase